MHILVTRPAHRAGTTLAALRAYGHDAVSWPLMETHACPWQPPAGDFDALVLSSAEAPRHAGPELARYAHLPVYCVGEATAAAAQRAGLQNIQLPVAGTAKTLFGILRNSPHRHVLHLTGRDVTPAASPDLRVERCIVYAAELLDWSDAQRETLDRFDWVLLYSARTAAHFSKICPARTKKSLKIAGLSGNVIAAAGDGWAKTTSAGTPDEQSLFAAAGLLCQKQD